MASAYPRCLRGRHRHLQRQRSLPAATSTLSSSSDNRGPAQLDIDTATDTIYAADQGNPNLRVEPNGSTVTVIDGKTCNGTNHGGCGANAAVVTVGSGVSAVAVDQANNTVYVPTAPTTSR